MAYELQNPNGFGVNSSLANAVEGIINDALDQTGLQALVSRAGIQSGIVASQIVPLGVWGQMPDGKYLTADFFPGAGRGRTSLALYNGDPAAADFSTSKMTSLAATRAADANVLKTAAGVALNTSGASITSAWPASNGDIFFVAVEGGNFYHLYRCKAGTYTVGADVGVTDGKAVLSLGMIGGTQTDQCRTFTTRNFCEAKVNGATHYFIGEYNVSTGRVDGGAKDAVRVYRSTDGGTTWATFLEWNTNGVHQVDHVHAVRQDPYTGWIYIITGDSDAENMLIAYNGTGSVVAANATAATIAGTAGYKVLSGSELNRYTDLCFSPDGIYSIPDADTETADAKSVAFVATTIPRTLDYVVTVGSVDRVPNVPPASSVQSPVSGDYMLTFCSSLAWPTYPYLDVFGADYKGGTWTRIAKLEIRSAKVPVSFFRDNQDRLWIYSDTLNPWFGPDSDYDGSSKTRSLMLTPGQRGSAPFVHLRG